MIDPTATATAAVAAAIEAESAAVTVDHEAYAAWQHWRNLVRAAAASPLGMAAFDLVLPGLGIATVGQGLEHSRRLQAAAADANRAMVDASYARQVAEYDLAILYRQADNDRFQGELKQNRADREARTAADWLARPGAIDALLAQFEERAVVGAVVAAEAVRR